MNRHNSIILNIILVMVIILLTGCNDIEKKQLASAGQQTADQDDLLIYKQIPQGTLYWLRNYTRGKEERIFTYEDGIQVWW